MGMDVIGMQIRVFYYRAIASPLVQAFVGIEIDGWLRFVGLNLMRDGSLQAAQLKTRSGSREGWLYFPAVVIPDDDLRERVTAEILTAIRRHIETLPPEQRMKPPVSPQSAARPTPVAAQPRPFEAKPKPTPAAKPTNGKNVLPPRRLLTKGGPANPCR